MHQPRHKHHASDYDDLRYNAESERLDFDHHLLRLCCCLAVVIVIGATLFVALFVFLQTDHGKRATISMLSSASYDDPEHDPLQYGPIEGIFPFRFIVKDVHFRSKGKRWAFAPRVHFDMNPWSLFFSRLAYVHQIRFPYMLVDEASLHDGDDDDDGDAVPPAEMTNGGRRRQRSEILGAILRRRLLQVNTASSRTPSARPVSWPLLSATVKFERFDLDTVRFVNARVLERVSRDALANYASVPPLLPQHNADGAAAVAAADSMTIGLLLGLDYSMHGEAFFQKQGGDWKLTIYINQRPSAAEALAHAYAPGSGSGSDNVREADVERVVMAIDASGVAASAEVTSSFLLRIPRAVQTCTAYVTMRSRTVWGMLASMQHVDSTGELELASCSEKFRSFAGTLSWSGLRTDANANLSLERVQFTHAESGMSLEASGEYGPLRGAVHWPRALTFRAYNNSIRPGLEIAGRCHSGGGGGGGGGGNGTCLVSAEDTATRSAASVTFGAQDAVSDAAPGLAVDVTVTRFLGYVVPITLREFFVVATQETLRTSSATGNARRLLLQYSPPLAPPPKRIAVGFDMSALLASYATPWRVRVRTRASRPYISADSVAMFWLTPSTRTLHRFSVRVAAAATEFAGGIGCERTIVSGTLHNVTMTLHNCSATTQYHTAIGELPRHVSRLFVAYQPLQRTFQIFADERVTMRGEVSYTSERAQISIRRNFPAQNWIRVGPHVVHLSVLRCTLDFKRRRLDGVLVGHETKTEARFHGAATYWLATQSFEHYDLSVEVSLAAVMPLVLGSEITSGYLPGDGGGGKSEERSVARETTLAGFVIPRVRAGTLRLALSPREYTCELICAWLVSDVSASAYLDGTCVNASMSLVPVKAASLAASFELVTQPSKQSKGVVSWREDASICAEVHTEWCAESETWGPWEFQGERDTFTLRRPLWPTWRQCIMDALPRTDE